MTQSTYLTTADGKIQRRVYVAVIAILFALPFVLPEFHMFLFGEVVLLALLATAFNLLYGYNGLLSFGHALFVSLAGYTFAVFFRDIAPALGLEGSFGSVEPIVMLVLGGILALIVTFIVTVPVGWLSVRLREIYFAIITLSFSMLFFSLADRDIGGWSNGQDGRTVIMGTAELFGIELSLVDPVDLFFFIIIVTIPAMWLMWRIVNSPFGSVSKAIRENPERAEAIGIDHRKHSWYMFTLSGMFSALVGIFLVPLRTFINPAVANWTFSADPVVMTVIGGPSNFMGPALGAFIFRYARWGIDQVPILSEHWEFVLGLIVLVAVMFFKGGVSELLKRIYQRARGHQAETGVVEEERA